MDQFELTHSFAFEAAHHLPLAGEDHPCRRLHGHSYRLEVTVAGALNDAGWVVDFEQIAASVRPVIAGLDHRVLNDLHGLENPTSEHLAAWLWARLHPSLPNLTEVAISETATTLCRYRGAS